MKRENKKKLRILGIAAFLNDFGADSIFPLWPVFLTSVLGANMVVLGFIDGLGEAMVSLSQAISGYGADRTGKRKVFIWLGYLSAGVARLGYAVAPSWPSIIPFRILDRAGKMRGAPRDAIISELSTVSDRGRNFGYLRMMDNLGAVAGVTFTLFFFNMLGYHLLFVLAGIPSLIGAFLVFKNIIETKRIEQKNFHRLRLKNLNADFKLYLILSAIFSIASFSYSFLLLYSQHRGFMVVTLPLLYLLYSATASAVSIPFGRLADRIHRKPVLILSFLFWLLSCGVFIISQNLFSIVIAFIFYGLHLGALEPVQRTMVSELAPPDLRASSLGTFQMIIGFSAMPASLLAGVLWQKFDPTIPFYFSAVLTVVAIILLLFVREKKSVLEIFPSTEKSFSPLDGL